MSFEIDNFSPVGGQARRGNSPAEWSYSSLIDDLATVLAPNYFDEVGTQVSAGDFINVSLLAGKAIITVLSTTLKPPGVVIDASAILPGGGGGGSGDFSGPAGAVTDNLVSFANATGKLGKDSGVSSGDVVEGPSSAVNDRIVLFNGTTGKLIKDSGLLLSELPPVAFSVEIFTGTTKNLVVADNLKFVAMDNAGAQTVVIPQNASEAFPVGAEIEFLREGVGTVTFSTSGAAVLQSRSGLVAINAQYSAAALKKIDTDEWRLFGDLA